MSDSANQINTPSRNANKSMQPMIIALLLVIALLLAGVIGMFFYQQKQNQQFQRMQAAKAYFDKLEKEEKELAERERIKAEQEKMRLALEEAKAEAKREADRAAARAATAKKIVVQRETYNPCKHVYAGKVFQTKGRFLFMSKTYSFTVLGFSSSTGKASVKDREDGSTQEIYCSQIPD